MSRPPVETPLTPDGRTLKQVFGFDLDGDSWLARVRTVAATPTFGRLGPYQILGVVGRGGQGIIYKVRQPRTGREIALKRLGAGAFATPEMLARFRREVEAAAALDHPNIVTVYGTEEIDEQLVLAMQRIDGVPFDRWACPPGRPRRDVREILAAFSVVCDAIHHAHQRGVIHRDLKPSNVLVDGENRPHVLDFGLAKFRSDDATDPTLTRTGAVVGTPTYASPEQLRGDTSHVDIRSDVYALGALLYHCLTGSPPVEPGISPTDMLRQIEAIGPRSLSSLNATLDRDLCAIVLKALHPDADGRYQSVDALRADVERFRDGKPVSARTPSSAYLVRKFVRRNRLAVTVASLFILLLVATAITTTVLYIRAVRERARADDESRRAKIALDQQAREAAIALNTQSFLQQMILSAGHETVARGATLSVRDMLDRAAERLDKPNQSIDPAVNASLRMTIANTYRELGLHALSEPHYRAAIELRKPVYGEQSAQVAECYDALARVYRILGRPRDAEGVIERAWAIYSHTEPENSGYLALTANSIGLIKRSLGKYDEAERWYLEAIRRYVLIWGPDNVNMPYLYINLGIAYHSARRFDDAERQLRAALQRSLELNGDKLHVDTLLSMSALADTLTARNDRSGEAEGLFVDSYRGTAALYGANHPRTAQLLQRYSNFRAATGRFEEACGLLLQAHQAFSASESWSELFLTTATLAALLQQSGRSSEALAILSCTVESFGPRARPDDPELAAAHLEIGAILLTEKQFTQAEHHLRCAESVFEPAGHAKLSRTRELLAQIPRD